MSPEDRIRLEHMRDACESALGFVGERDRQDLDSDLMLVFALARAMEVIGEAASKVTPSGREALPELPWGHIVGMRNRLIHAYFDVDLDIVWNTVTVALPELLAQLQAALSSDN